MRHYNGPVHLGPLMLHPNRTDEAGDVIPTHKHNHPHVVTFVQGCWHLDAVEKDGTPRSIDYWPGDMAVIAAGVEHTFTQMPNARRLAVLDRLEAAVAGGDAAAIAAFLASERDAATRHGRFICAFAHRDDDGNVIQEYRGNWEAAV